MPSSTMILVTLLLVVGSYTDAASTGPCKKFFPLAAAAPANYHVHGPDHLVAVPGDSAGRSYAPLCADGRHIDIRRMQSCQVGHCWSALYQDCSPTASPECTIDHSIIGPRKGQSRRMQQSWAQQQAEYQKQQQQWQQQQILNQQQQNMNIQQQQQQNNGAGTGVDWASNGVNNGANGNNGGNNLGGLGGDQNQNGQTAWNNQNGNGNWWSNGDGSNGSGTGTDWANNGVSNGWANNGFNNGANSGANNSCGAAQCYVAAYSGCFHITSVECRFPPPTPRPISPFPTSRPVFAIVTTMHPVNILVRYLPRGESLSPESRSLILRYAREMIENNLNADLELVEVAFGGYLLNGDWDENTGSVPLAVTVRGPRDVSDFALSYVMEVVNDNMEDMLNLLKSDDWNTFQNVALSAESYDFDAISFQTRNPTRIPTKRPSRRPSKRPTPRPTVRPMMKIVTKFLPVQAILENLPSSYSLSENAKLVVLDYAKEELKNNLGGNVELVDINLGGGFINGIKGKSQVPLRVEVKVGEDDIERAQSLVMDVMEGAAETIEWKLKAQDWGNFKNVDCSFDTYDFNDVTYDSRNPTRPPTKRPSRRPTSRPTPRPSPANIKIERTVQLSFYDVAPDYTMSTSDRVDLVAFANDALMDNLDSSLEFIEVEYAGNRNDQSASSFPLRVTVKCQPDQSEFAKGYILSALEQNMDEIIKKMKSLNWSAFREASLSTDDPASIESVLTEHSVQITLYDVAPGYTLSAIDQIEITEIVKEIFEANLDPSFELINMEYEGSGYNPNTRGVGLSSFPFAITVKGPSTQSAFATDFIESALEQSTDDILTELKSMNWSAFKTASLTIDDPDSIVIVKAKRSVQLSFYDVASDYRLSASDRMDMVGFAREALEENLDSSFELVMVDYAGNVNDKRLFMFPLDVTVKCPSIQLDYAKGYIMAALEANMDEIMRKMKSMDYSALKNISLSIDDPDAIAIIDMDKASQMENTKHNVKLTLKNAASLTVSDRASIVALVKDLMDANLNDSFTLLGIRSTDRTDDLALPLRITVKGPADESKSALSYVMEVLEKNDTKIRTHIKSLNYNANKDVSIDMETYDPQSPPSGSGPSPGPKPSDSKPSKPSGSQPGPDVMESRAHVVKLKLNNVPDGHQPSQDTQASMAGFVKDILVENYDGGEIVSVEPASIADRKLLSPNLHHIRRLDTASLPFSITVKGPANESDSVEDKLANIIEDHEDDLDNYLKSLDDAYKTVSTSVEPYDPEDEDDERENTVHHVQLTMDNLPDKYTLTATDRASIIRFVKELLDEHIDDLFKLISVAHGGGGVEFHQKNIRRLGAVSLPLSITVEGPADLSDFALSYVMEVLSDHKADLLRLLKSLDWTTFKNVVVSYASFDPLNMVQTEKEVTEHQVYLAITEVPAGYNLSTAKRRSVVRFVRKLLDDYLDTKWELIQAAYDTGSKSNRSLMSYIRRLENFSLPIMVTVRGPADDSDVASPHILQTLRDHVQEIESHLKSLDKAFKGSTVSVETDLPRKTTPAADGEGDVPSWFASWWVWTLIGIGVLFVLCCCLICCCTMCRYRYLSKQRDAEANDTKPFIVEKPLIIEKPVFIPSQEPRALVPYQASPTPTTMVPYQPPPPGAVVLYGQPHPDMMVPFQSRGNRALPEIEPAQSSRILEILPSEHDTYSGVESWDLDTAAMSTVLHNDPPGETHLPMPSQQPALLQISSLAHHTSQASAVGMEQSSVHGASRNKTPHGDVTYRSSASRAARRGARTNRQKRGVSIRKAHTGVSGPAQRGSVRSKASYSVASRSVRRTINHGGSRSEDTYSVVSRVHSSARPGVDPPEEANLKLKLKGSSKRTRTSRKKMPSPEYYVAEETALEICAENHTQEEPLQICHDPSNETVSYSYYDGDSDSGRSYDTEPPTRESASFLEGQRRPRQDDPWEGQDRIGQVDIV